jgi:bis(5'-nucleosidyl)-tetraphosphatase
MLEERSAGAILFFRNGKNAEYLVLHYPAGHWDFPKGNVEEGESDEAAAKREVMEETGITHIKLVMNFQRTIEYHYWKKDQLIRKRVIFYLAETSLREVHISFEHSGYAWLPFTETLSRVTFKNARNILMDAHKFLLKSGYLS